MDTLKRLKEFMDARGWSSYRLAGEAGLSHSTVSNMFERNTMPSIHTLEALCRALGITMAQFFDTEDTKEKDGYEVLFEKWSRLSARQKQCLLEIMDVM